MTRDYSKKKSSKRRSSATPKVAEKKSFAGLIYMVVGLSIGLFIAFLVYLDQQPTTSSNKLAHPANPNRTQSSKNVNNSKTKAIKKAKVAEKKATKKNNKQQKPIAQVPKYEFYTMLPDVEIEVNVPPVVEKSTIKKKVVKETTNTAKVNKAATTKQQLRVDKSRKSPPKLNNKNLYQLQVGAFQSKDKAESMKAQLAFMGVQSKVSSSILTNGKNVYKVKIGPSKDENNLKLIKSKLKKMNINTFLQKI